MKFNQEEFNRFIIDQKIVGFFEKPIKLVSGRESVFYANWRNVAEDVFLMDKLSDFLLAFVADKNLEVDCFFGTPDGATKLAVITQYKFAKAQKDYGEGKYPLAMGRKTPKDHGEEKDRYFVGAPMGKVVVLEDVTTTGGSLLKSVKGLVDMGIEVVAAVALTNRNEVMDDGRHVREALAELGVDYLGMSQAKELLPMIWKEKGSLEELRGEIDEEFGKYGEEPIEWEGK